MFCHVVLVRGTTVCFGHPLEDVFQTVLHRHPSLLLDSFFYINHKMDRVLAILEDPGHQEHPLVREWALLMYSALFEEE